MYRLKVYLKDLPGQIVSDIWVDKEVSPLQGQSQEEIETKIKESEVTLKITDFQLPPTAELAEIASKVNDSKELIDYWAIDWDYKGDTLHNQWQSFGVKKNPKVDYVAKHRYEDAGEYQIMVKVVDVFGNDKQKAVYMENEQTKYRHYSHLHTLKWTKIGTMVHKDERD